MTSEGEVDLEAAVEPAGSGGRGEPAGSGGRGEPAGSGGTSQGAFRRVHDFPAGRVMSQEAIARAGVCDRG